MLPFLLQLRLKLRRRKLLNFLLKLRRKRKKLRLRQFPPNKLEEKEFYLSMLKIAC
jgi:hypothetical protein